jgi:chorismate--pyruvate lyase
LAYKSTLLKNEPNWQSVSITKKQKPAASINNWLRESGSLTRRLKLLCGEQFNVSVQYQHWAKPTVGEQHVLGIRNGEYANIREVMLRRQDEVLVVARTIIPRQMLVGRQRHLISLGTKPLGEVIFAEPGLKRSRFETAAINPQSCQSQVLDDDDYNETIWGRRSCYILHHKPILISEIFLPALFRYEATR